MGAAVFQRAGLQFRTTSFKAELRSEGSFGVDTKLEAGMKGIGVDIGGKFEELTETVWQ